MNFPCHWNWFFLAQTGSHWECQEKMVQTGYELVLPCCWNWLWLVQTGFSLSLKLAQTGSSLFKLVFTSCECQEKMVQTGYELVLPYCWNWLWLAQTGSSWPKLFLTGYGEYQEKMVQTGSSLLLKLTVTKLVHTGSCAWQANTYLWRKMVEIGSSFCSSTIWCWQLGWLWLVQSGPHFATLLHWLAQTGSYWLLCMTSKFIFMEEVFSLPPARNHQVHLKSFMADQAGLNMTDVKQKLIQRPEHCML